MSENLTEVFGIDVFNEAKMKECMPKNTFKELKQVIDNGGELSLEAANVIANAMKDWAVANGATHYTHWFQPLTGITAEKHDSFIEPAGEGRILMEFSGKGLIKGEPDASSFPSGGLRATFEARGYTAWDCTSPAFIRRDAAGATLCIPTAFCSYTGEALDKKTPLLRSMDAISRQAVRIVHLFGHPEVKRVDVSVGAEQEYFIVDHENFMKREDLMLCGRTLFGAAAPKGQELEDHYFGSIKERIALYMRDLNWELWKLGILAKTQHNEVAPAQHELAPIYSSVNIATDHNQLVMDAMKKIAKRHGLECLLHEKPFAGVNGSGKHDNWSIVTDTGKNLLDPGKTPNENIQFLLFLSAIIKAVDENAKILRLSASNPGNDHRLGANEAPPAIISVFLGEQLEDVVAQLIATGEAKTAKQGGTLSTGARSLPTLAKDATDRNRTSPFAFTGNKFEFRMVGSSMSIAEPNTILNGIVAQTLEEMADELEAAEDFDQAVHDLIKKTLSEHERIIFNGNGYSDEWVEEAERRGLPNVKTFVEAIEALTDPATVKLFEHQKIYTATEMRSRAEINYENYGKIINIEARTMIDMASKLYIPAVIKYTRQLADSINSVRSACPSADVSVQEDILSEVSSLLSKTKKALDELVKADEAAVKIENAAERAKFFKFDVFPKMEALRAPVDRLETIVDAKDWPVPSYEALMFEV